MEIDLEASLRALGVPLTRQRLAIYESLRKSTDHPSAEDLYRALKRRYPALSLATVYKSLQTFEKLGLISLVNRPHAQARYDAITEKHHHAICEACGRIADLFDRRLDALPPPVDAAGFAIKSHSVHFRGLCAGCKKNSSNRRKS